MDSYINKIFVALEGFRFNDGTTLLSRITTNEMLEIAYKIETIIDRTNQDLVTEFNETFKVEKEETNIVEDFKHSELRIALILEECIELAFALGYSKYDLYSLYNKLSSKVYNNPPLLNNGERVVEVFDAGIDLLVVVYGLFDVFNMAAAVNEGMKEVHKSNMSKLCKNIFDLQDTLKKHKEEGLTLITEESNGMYIVRNRATNKIAKSNTYQSPNLKQILINHKIL